MTEPEPRKQLTPQQGRVAAMVADGQTDKQIAIALGIHVQTVRFHIRRIAETWKLNPERVTRVEIAKHMQQAAA